MALSRAGTDGAVTVMTVGRTDSTVTVMTVTEITVSTARSADMAMRTAAMTDARNRRSVQTTTVGK